MIMSEDSFCDLGKALYCEVPTTPMAGLATLSGKAMRDFAKMEGRLSLMILSSDAASGLNYY